PTDHPRPASSVYQPDCQVLTLPETLTQALKALSSSEGVSLYVTLLTAFKILLHHYTGQTDLLVNSPAAGRHQSQTRDIIGCFINTLPIRSTLSSRSTFKDYLQQVSQIAEAALANQDVSFRQFVEMIHLANPSIPGALFILQNVPYPVFERPGLKVSSTYLHRQHGKPESANYFDLTLSIQEQAGTLTASLAYNAVLFNPDRIEQMLRHYQTLLEEVVADPNCTIATLPMLTETERQHLPSSALPTARQRSESTAAFVAPRIELERQLAEIWSTVLGIKSIGVRDNFFNLGGNSLLAVQVVAEIEKTCGYKMPVIDFFRAQTIEHLSKLLLSPLLQQEVASLPWNPLEPVKPEQSTPKTIKAPLFILNGGFNQFLSGAIWIAQRLGKEQPCYSLHMRGIDGREEPHDRVETMAEDAIQAIRTVQPEGPYYLVGLCFGGMVAYEMAQQLRQQGQKVALLLTVESASPIPREKQQDTGIEARLKRIPTPEMFDARTRTSPVLLKVFQAAHQAMASYEAEPYSGKLIVFQASEGNETEQHDRECYLATWKQLASEVEVHTLPGDHISLYVEENIWTLVSELKACLAQARLENE
ncbi:hypothetical protein H6F89_28865, partial [Cyanobacteria bacterium FACHB-63]|nr:hypothetical protein [Cyanobacteria bacterium FACHB-63]